MSEEVLIGLTLIILLGTSAQWLAWRFRLPSILVLLTFGIVSGPAVADVVHPDELFGELLLPIVSISVAIILFEGGLTLKFVEITGFRRPIRNLISIGTLISWGLIAMAAFYILELNAQIAILLGAILVVSGPTVIMPLLRQVRPSGSVGPVLMWEGILIDPIGATLALFVFEEITSSPDLSEITLDAVLVLGQTFLIGTILGYLAAQLMLTLYRNYWAPDYLQSPIALMMVVGAFALSNELQPESGLLTATVMGMVLANQNRVPIRHIVEFKETLGVLLLSGLFIVLAARLDATVFEYITLRSILFLAVLVLIVRPLVVFISTFNSNLSRPEKVFLSFMAPRGIVAAAVSSIFALELEELGFEGAEDLVPYTFMVIIGTVIIYGLSASPLARRLGLAVANPQGVIIVGAHTWARKIAKAIDDAGIKVYVVDTNAFNIEMCHQEGIPAYHGNVLSESFVEHMDFGSMGRVMALTSNNEVNTLAVIHLREVFGRAEIYRLNTSDEDFDLQSEFGRVLFGDKIKFGFLDHQFYNGAEIVVKTIDAENTKLPEEGFVPFFAIDSEGILSAWTVDNKPTLRAGMKVIGINTV